MPSTDALHALELHTKHLNDFVARMAESTNRWDREHYGPQAAKRGRPWGYDSELLTELVGAGLVKVTLNGNYDPFVVET